MLTFQSKVILFLEVISSSYGDLRMLCIIITGQISNAPKARLYQKGGRTGPFRLVPTYKAIAVDTKTKQRIDFSVTRWSSRVVFNNQLEKYGTYGECPPNKKQKPYFARPEEHHSKTFALKLFEETDPERIELRGQGSTTRSHIMIHKGPGCSLGCIMIAGGKKGHARFTKKIKRILTGVDTILVAIKPTRT
jgi:hypothetical protein